ncbi:MAG: AEC family transporter [Nitrospirae bacterium]|nr:AEC family transporter [Nitrospirota bacterium]
MYEIFNSFALIVCAGILFRRLRVGGPDADSIRLAINALVFNLFLPALCIMSVYTSRMDIDTILVPVTAGLTTIFTMIVSLAAYSVLGKVTNMTKPEKGVLVISATFGNVVYLGLPVITGLYGAGAAKYALFYDLFAGTPLLWLLGASVASRYGGGGKIEMGDSLRTIASLPPVWGLIAGMALKAAGVGIPEFIVKALDMLGGLVIPLMVFSIGLALSMPKVKHASLIVPAVIIKLAVAPFIAFTIAHLLGVKGNALASCFIEGAMPTMVLSLLIAARFGLDTSLAGFMIVVTTVLSFFTLPLAVSLTR